MASVPETEGRPLLLVDDDAPFRQRLSVLLARKGFAVTSVGSLQEARVEAARLNVRVVMLTGYGNLATAVAAVKAGAIDYLAKPADPEDIVRALSADGSSRPEAPPEPMSADRVRWEHIQRVYELCDRNVSETARRLKMHRRTLQRILAKRSPK